MPEKNRNCIAAVKLCFLAAVILALASGIGRALLCPKEVNSYESRMADQLPAALSERFPEETEAALSDQLPLSTYFRKAYNLLKYKFQEQTSLKIAGGYGDKYFHVQEVELYNGMLTAPPAEPGDASGRIAAVIGSFNRAMALNPEPEYYFYYAEGDLDNNFETGEKGGFREYIQELTDVKPENFAFFEISSFGDYAKYYYATDHHWNHRGSYKGYTEIRSLLGCEGEALEPLEECTLSDWHGTRATDIGFEAYNEPFVAYRFAFPEMSVRLNGEEAADYGNQELYLAGGGGKISYLNFYGNNYTGVELDTGHPERENLLVIGDSFAHAVLKPLASHFNRTFLLDSRQGTVTQEALSSFIEENRIDKVLFLGYLVSLDDMSFALGE